LFEEFVWANKNTLVMTAYFFAQFLIFDIRLVWSYKVVKPVSVCCLSFQNDDEWI